MDNTKLCITDSLILAVSFPSIGGTDLLVLTGTCMYCAGTLKFFVVAMFSSLQFTRDYAVVF